MMIFSLLSLLSWQQYLVIASNVEQLHLSYSGIETSMVVEFVNAAAVGTTEGDCVEAVVQYTQKLLLQPELPAAYKQTAHLRASITNSEESDTVAVAVGGAAGEVPSAVHFVEQIGCVHFAEMRNLEPGVTHIYRIGSNTANGNGTEWTAWIDFLAGYPTRDNSASDRKGDDPVDTSTADGIIAVLADFGLENDVSMERLTLEAGSLLNAYDSIALVGDLAYNMYDDNSQRGSAFMRLLSNFTQNKPLMVAAGNHEHGDNFTNYAERFRGIKENAGRRSGSDSNFYYSYDLGLVHFIVVNTEVYKYPEAVDASPFPFTTEQQLEWLESDLIKANDNRDNVPWIVMMGHKGWYMNYWGDFRVQDEITGNFTGFDDLGCKYGVDLFLTGHVHIYQRFLPVRGPSEMRFMAPPVDVDNDCVSEDGHFYTDPIYMPTLVVASPGDEEVAPRISCVGTDLLDELFWKHSQQYCTAAYGFGHLQAVNHTHLYWEFVETGRADNIFSILPDQLPVEGAPVDGNAVSEEHVITAGNGKEKQYSKEKLDAILHMSFPSTDWVSAVGSTAAATAAGATTVADGVSVHTESPPLHTLTAAAASSYAAQEQRERLSLPVKAGPAATVGATGDDRVVRDYLWIVQNNHGPRDYCG